MSAVFSSFGRVFARLTLYFLLVTTSSALHVSNIVARSNSNNCKEVLTKNLECPSIGSFPVAGACDYFVRCYQTDNGVDSLADFCPDGEVFVINRCVKSHGVDDCPQKACPQLSNSSPPKPKPTTERPYAPTTTTTSPTRVSVTKRHPPLVFTSKRPILPNLHPSLLNGASVFHAGMILLLLVIMNIIIAHA